MKITEELIKKYAGKRYDDGQYSGIIAGYNIKDKTVLLIGDYGLWKSLGDYSVKNMKNYFGSELIILHDWEGDKHIAWLNNFDPKFVVGEEEVSLDIGKELESINSILDGIQKSVKSLEAVVEKTKKEPHVNKLRLEVNAENSLCLRYGSNLVGFIDSSGKCHMLSSCVFLDTYEEWCEDGCLIDEEVVSWRGGSYGLEKICASGDVRLQRLAITCGGIYHLTKAIPIFSCNDVNIVRTKSTNTPVIF